MAIIHARLDEEAEALCLQLNAQLGWSESRIVREGIKALAPLLVKKKGSRRIIGQGEFSSGVENRGSDKQHLRGFGA